MFKVLLLSLTLISVTGNKVSDPGYCDKDSKMCNEPELLKGDKYLFYDVNPPEGFNLRRDVYMRLAIMLAEAQKKGEMKNWKLVLPPWYKLYHWRKRVSNEQSFPWGAFFDLYSLKEYAPVIELYEIFPKNLTGNFEIDVLYVLKNYYPVFDESNTFEDMWEITDDVCEYDGEFWGYNNITAKEILCVKFQGKASILLEILQLHKKERYIMIDHAEIPIHDNFGNKAFWDCRKSMKFHKDLVKLAKNYIQKYLECSKEKCDSYISVHLRRRDFTNSHKDNVPSLKRAAFQIHHFIRDNCSKIRNIFIATDAPYDEKVKIKNYLLKWFEYRIFFYEPNETEMRLFTEGGVAIIEQIICSHGAYFIGTHESTFTHRIEQEREILGFDSSTTFNRLCPDEGYCEKPAVWSIVN